MRTDDEKHHDDHTAKLASKTDIERNRLQWAKCPRGAARTGFALAPPRRPGCNGGKPAGVESNGSL